MTDPILVIDNEDGITSTNYFDSEWNKQNLLFVWTASKHSRYYLLIPTALWSGIEKELVKNPLKSVDICKRKSNGHIRITFEDNSKMPFFVELHSEAMPLGINTKCNRIVVCTSPNHTPYDLKVTY